MSLRTVIILKIMTNPSCLEEDQESNNDNYDYIYNLCLHNAISTN